MNRKLTLAGMTGIALLVGCSGSSYKLGGDTQATENAGGSGGSAETGGVTGAQGGDPSAFGGSAGDGVPGGQVGGSVGTGGVYVPPAGDAGLAGGPGTWGTGGVTGSFGGSTGTGGVSAPQPAGPQGTPGITANGTGGTAGDGFVGSWTGYVENGHFQSGSDALQLTVDRVSDTELSGHLVMGQGSGTPPDPAILASVGGSPGYDPIEGYSYTAMNGKATGQRLEFDIALDEAWGSLCSAQTPVPGTYSCLPPADSYYIGGGHCYGLHGGTQEEIDCATYALCMGPMCKCDDTHCFVDTSVWVSHFDLTLRSPYLDGSAVGGPFNPNNVHFTPQ